MASLTAATATPTAVRATLVHKGGAAGIASPVLGLPKMKMGGKVRCSAEKRNAPSLGVAPALAAMSVIAASNPAWALVDERLTTEGTGLSLGVSNNLLVWILLGVFGLIWALYTSYTTTLDDDEDSALSL